VKKAEEIRWKAMTEGRTQKRDWKVTREKGGKVRNVRNGYKRGK
jgi:hypothetical protein